MDPIMIYTDGSCNTQTGDGGWASILVRGDKKKTLTGSADKTTVNIMELTAAIEGLKTIKQMGQSVVIVTDSQYLSQGLSDWSNDWVNNGWKTSNGKPVANKDLWQALLELTKRHQVTTKWIPREENGEADELAQRARKRLTIAKTPDDAQSKVSTEMIVLLTGSRDASPAMLNFARRAVQQAHRQGYTIMVGDNPKGIDMAVVKECHRLNAKVIVVGIAKIPRNGGCYHGRYLKIDPMTYLGMGGQKLDGYTVRDRYMVDQAHTGLFIWNGSSPGTKAGHDYMLSRHKKAQLIQFSPDGKRL